MSPSLKWIKGKTPLPDLLNYINFGNGILFVNSLHSWLLCKKLRNWYKEGATIQHYHYSDVKTEYQPTEKRYFYNCYSGNKHAYWSTLRHQKLRIPKPYWGKYWVSVTVFAPWFPEQNSRPLSEQCLKCNVPFISHWLWGLTVVRQVLERGLRSRKANGSGKLYFGQSVLS